LIIIRTGYGASADSRMITHGLRNSTEELAVHPAVGQASA
jgi:hypothetical protein